MADVTPTDLGPLPEWDFPPDWQDELDRLEAIDSFVEDLELRELEEEILTDEADPDVQADLWQWVTTERDNVCPDCEERHGEVRPLAEWEAFGLPGSGWSVCQEHCHCFIAPATGEVEGKVRRERDPDRPGRTRARQDDALVVAQEGRGFEGLPGSERLPQRPE